jgi:hypothetical protein
MYSSNSNNPFFNQDVFKLAEIFSHRLELFLAPLLFQLDAHLDKRLVNAFSGLCQSIIRLRSRSTGLVLSELGGYLLSFDKAPAGTKRISNLLRSPKWEDKLITEYLATGARQYVERLLEKQEDVLLLWDERVQEKPESIESEGLCAVRSSKAKRLLRIKRGYYDPPTKAPVHVPGLRWVGLLLCGMKEQPMVGRFKWWTSRGKNFTTLKPVRYELLQWTREQFSSAVLHVFDRGYAGREWLGLLLAKQDRFLLRWPSAYQLLDRQGRLKRASRFSVGRKATSSKQVWDMRSKNYLKRSLLWMPCLHKDYADNPLTLIICRPGKKGRQPWYLLTNEKIENDQGAWKLVHAYARRWQVEQTFRFSKSELAMESCRLWFWNNKMKLLQTVTLVYAFLLSLLEEQLQKKIKILLRKGCHRTGKRCREASTPLYRIRLALTNLWNLFLNSSFQNSG